MTGSVAYTTGRLSGCIENRLQEKRVEKQEICQEVMAATQAGDNSLDHDDRDGGKEQWLVSAYI